MQRVLLRFENLQQVVGSEELSVIILTDEQRTRLLSVVCDYDMSRQLSLRINNPDLCRTLLPEVLLQMLPSHYEMLIVGVYDGQYQVLLMDVEGGNSVRIRISDAVLLAVISNVPLYIEERLMRQQSSPFNEEATGVAIPINTMDMLRLKHCLKKAVADENYELASQLRDEINRRKKP